MSQELGIMENRIKSFVDLDAWKEGHKLVLAIYKLTKDFPKEELFGLSSQMRRAVVSITSNVAEGFSRASYREKSQFYLMALGSLTEVQNQLFVARDLGYLKDGLFAEVEFQTIKEHKILNGLIKSSRALFLTPNS